MTTYTFPTSIRPSAVDWQLVYNSQGFISPLTSAEQTLELPGAKWIATLRFDNLKRHEIADLEVLIAQLRGKANRVMLYDHFRETPRGSAPGAPVVMGAGQTGTSLITDGWTFNQSGILLKADRFSVNNELKMITADASSNPTGQSTLTFEPPLRYSPLDNAVITVTQAASKMMLLDDSQGKLSTRGSLTNTILTFVEDIL